MTASPPVEGELVEPRPEPVLDAGKLAGLVSAAVVAVVGLVLLVVAGNVLGDLDALGNALNSLGLALAALVAYVAPVWQARKARTKVTPLESPRDADGNVLGSVLELEGVGDYGPDDPGQRIVTTNPADLIPASPLDPYLVDTRTPGDAAHAAPDE